MADTGTDSASINLCVSVANAYREAHAISVPE
jgi:hypothetical protein